MKKNNVAIVGYYGTGSSAVIDLLKEYSSVNIAAPIDGDYEHNLFYSKGGLFDLGAILMNQCSPYNSDMAVNNFLDCSRWQNDNDFGWFGSYRKHFGNVFLKITDEFIDSISKKKKISSAVHITKVRFSPIKAILQLCAKVIYGRKIGKLGRKYIYDGKYKYFSMPTKEEFTFASKKYTTSYINLFSQEGKVNVFDHLLWAQQTALLNDYFEDLKVIIVNRDPRDVYLLNKYYWHKPPVSNVKPFFPTNVEDFVFEWERSIVEKQQNCDNILYINFEDLIYKYEETVQKIEQFLEISPIEHVKKGSFFHPDMSIENTQIFELSKEWKDEVEPLKQRLLEHVYSFKELRVPDKNKWLETRLLCGKEKKK
ncbi:sulfotransferase domain-containing protein [Acholeplasma sp. OttesenSCG-928-E16]|nr:sulfotransferase domain-containing protein [Acholeplasma sp. OttesenSCG-928-E16]